MVIGIDVKTGLVEKLRDMRVPERMLSHAVSDLNDSRRLPRRAPSVVRNLESVFAVEGKIFAPHADAPPVLNPFTANTTD
jgi:hypothetical protein